MICVCNKVTKKQIETHVDNGVVKYYEMQRLTDAGSTCGSCAPAVIDVIYKRAKNAPSTI